VIGICRSYLFWADTGREKLTRPPDRSGQERLPTADCPGCGIPRRLRTAKATTPTSPRLCRRVGAIRMACDHRLVRGPGAAVHGLVYVDDATSRLTVVLLTGVSPPLRTSRPREVLLGSETLGTAQGEHSAGTRIPTGGDAIPVRRGYTNNIDGSVHTPAPGRSSGRINVTGSTGQELRLPASRRSRRERSCGVHR